MKKLSALVIVLLLTLSLSAQVKLSGGVKIGGSAKVTTQAGGGETNFVNDTFTEASDTELSLHTPELGGAWVDHPDGAYPEVVTVIGASDRIAIASVNGGAYYNDTTPPSADYCVEAVLHVVSTVSANTSLVARMDTIANTGLIFQFNNGTGWRVRKIVTGTQTTIGAEDTTTNIPSAGESRTVKGCVIGNVTTMYVNDVLLSGVGGTDSSVTAAGRAGVRFVGAQATTAGYHFESFRAFTP